MNTEALKLKVKSFAELNRTNNYEVYNIHEMDNVDLFLAREEDSGVYIVLDKEFNKDHDWFVHLNGIIESLSKEELNKLIKEKADEISGLYYELEGSFKMPYHLEVVTSTLKDYVIEIDEEELEDYHIIYQDVNLEEIASFISNKNLYEIELNLTFSDYAGGWDVLYSNDMYYLAQFK